MMTPLQYSPYWQNKFYLIYFRDVHLDANITRWKSLIEKVNNPYLTSGTKDPNDKNY